MTEFRKMTPLDVELKPIFERLRANCMTKEEIEKFDREEREKQARSRRENAYLYLETTAGERIVAVLKDKKNWRETRAVMALRNLKPGGCAFIQGGVGCGKTVAGALEIVKAYEKGHSAVFVESSKLTLKDDYLFADVLVIDDVGTEFASEYWRAGFTSVVNYRHSHRLTTVFLTNLTPQQWATRYDLMQEGSEKEGRIFSRIKQWTREPGSVILISGEEDLRQTQGVKDVEH
jgi:DNA replication protein DnaC